VRWSLLPHTNGSGYFPTTFRPRQSAPAWIATYQIDPTRDEALRFASTLVQAGVPTELHHYAGAFHLAHAIPGTAIGARILSDKLAAIRRILAPEP
jgi:acetyl esterase/lipase